MNHKTSAHRIARSGGTFEEHRCGRRTARKRSAWRFYDAERSFAALFEQHFRMTARAAALDAKHQMPARASHAKSF